MIEDLKEEVYLFNLLRQVFLKEPTRELVDGLLEVDLPADEDDEISKGLKLMFESVRRNSHRLNEWMEELAVEYARLFIRPKDPPAMPYASFYLSESRSLMTDETIDVRKRYLDVGLVVKELYSTPDDHIGIELEFFYYLTERIICLFDQGRDGEASRLLEIRKGFLIDHLSKWIPEFTDRVVLSTNIEFYKGAALLLKGCISLTSRQA